MTRLSVTPPDSDLRLEVYGSFWKRCKLMRKIELDLSNHPWTPVNAAPFVFLWYDVSPNVVGLNMSNILGLETEESDTSTLLKALSVGFKGAPLEKLVVSHNQLGVTIRNLSPLLESSTLVSLEMKNCALGDEAMDFVCNSLLRGGATCLQDFVVDGNCLGERGAVRPVRTCIIGPILSPASLLTDFPFV